VLTLRRHPREGGDPVSRAADDETERLSVLDTPLSRSMTVRYTGWSVRPEAW